MMIGTKIPITPGHPNLMINIALTPINEKGKTKLAKNNGSFNSIILKSLDNMFVTLLIYAFFITN